MKKTLILCCLLCSSALSGCGYSTRSLSPMLADIKTVYIAPFKNSVDLTSESRDRNLYIPLIEVKVTSETINRFMNDGNLKVAKEETADAILKGELLNYRRDVLRYNDDNTVLEYRISIVVSLALWNTKKNEALWTEPQFTGDTTYFVSGSQAKAESAAITDAIKDLAKRIVERTIEDW